MNEKYSSFVSSEFIVGRGSLDYIGQLQKKRAVVIYDDRVITLRNKKRINDLIVENGGACKFILDIKNEPYLSDIYKAADEMNKFNPDLIIAIGGGSVMDTAKAIHLFYEHPEITMREALVPYGLPKVSEKAILVTIPTTSGTGSETTSAAVFIDDETKEKRLMLSNELIPRYAILDADFTDSLPGVVASNTGLDALTHALEAAVCVNASSMVVSIALGAAVEIIENLENSISLDGSIEEREKAREICHIAASLAGTAITNACAGLAHGFDQPGAYFNLPHGMVCGILLPYTTAFACPHESYVKIAKRLGLEGEDSQETCQNLVDYLIQFNKNVGIPHSFSEVGLDETEFLDKLDDFALLAISAVATRLSPKVPSFQEAKELLKRAYYGEKPVIKV